jgi:hypothetical protein
MSAKTEVKSSTAATTDEAVIPSPVLAGVLTEPDGGFRFPEYEDNGAEVRVMTDIKHLFAEGFRGEAYEFQWKLFKRMDEMTAKYFVPVRKATHGSWFKESAFRPADGLIGCGHGQAPGTPELVLAVRPVKAKLMEAEALQRAIARRSNRAVERGSQIEQTQKQRAAESQGGVVYVTDPGSAWSQVAR